jgi:hypothetical protein
MPHATKVDRHIVCNMEGTEGEFPVKLSLKPMETVGVAVAAMACVVLTASAATPNDTRWSERTVVQFDRPVMIPGKILQPGTYIFQLADTQPDRDVLRVYTADPNAPDDERNLVATTLAVPTKREQPNGDVVLKFAHTEGPGPVALKAFFYPGTLRGHEFVYSHDEAARIATATKSVVLSHDTARNDMEPGTLYTVDANGRRRAWRQDPDVGRDWAAWVETQHPAQPARTRWMHDTDVVGTSGRTPAPATSNSTLTSEQHADAITRLVDQALHGSGNTITIDRSTLEQIRSHAEAIRNGGGSR